MTDFLIFFPTINDGHVPVVFVGLRERKTQEGPLKQEVRMKPRIVLCVRLVRKI
jgi:hypothetical protein